MRFTREQLLIGSLRTMIASSDLLVTVQAGRPVLLTGGSAGWSERGIKTEVPEDPGALSQDLSTNERYLLSLCDEIYYGKIRVTVDSGQITKVAVVEWSRKLEDVELTEPCQHVGKLVRKLIGGIKTGS